MNANDIVLWVVVACVAFLIGQNQNRTAREMVGERPGGSRTDEDANDLALVSYRTWVLRFITRSYSIDEINTLAFELGINHEQIIGESIGARGREFILYCERDGLIPQMLNALQVCRQ